MRDRAHIACDSSRAGRRSFRRAVVVIENGLVLAAGLRSHHRRLCAGDELTRVHRVVRALRDPDRHGHLPGRLELDLAQTLGEARSEPQRVSCIARGHDHAELLSSDATDDVGLSHGLPRQARELDQQLVACPVAVDVVDAFEVVEVEHQDGDRVVGARCTRQLRPQTFMEKPVVVETGERIRLRQMLQPRADLRVVDRQCRGVGEPLGELELVLGEACLLPDPIDVQRALERTACDQRDADQRLGLDRRSRDGDHPRIEVRLVREDGLAVLDRPAGDALPEARTALHDLVLVGLRAGEHRDQHAPVLVDLVDVQGLVRHQVGEGLRDAVEERIQALFGQDQVEDLGQASVRLDQVHRPATSVTLVPVGLERRSRLTDHSRDHRRPARLP